MKGIERLKNLPLPIESYNRTAWEPDEDCGEKLTIPAYCSKSATGGDIFCHAVTFFGIFYAGFKVRLG